VHLQPKNQNCLISRGVTNPEVSNAKSKSTTYNNTRGQQIMFSKVKTFGFVITALIIAPSAAFAQDFQVNQQNIDQVGVAIGRGNTVVNNAHQQSIQNSTSVGNGYCKPGGNVQVSNQNIQQTGVAIGEFNTVVNQANQLSVQDALKIANGYCR
jgi:hypothetical protein